MMILCMYACVGVYNKCVKTVTEIYRLVREDSHWGSIGYSIRFLSIRCNKKIRISLLWILSTENNKNSLAKKKCFITEAQNITLFQKVAARLCEK